MESLFFKWLCENLSSCIHFHIISDCLFWGLFYFRIKFMTIFRQTNITMFWDAVLNRCYFFKNFSVYYCCVLVWFLVSYKYLLSFVLCSYFLLLNDVCRFNVSRSLLLLLYIFLCVLFRSYGGLIYNFWS